MASAQRQIFRVRISDVMTVRQLQGECRHRGIKRFSGKSKAWLLDQLGVGTVWKSRPSSTIIKTSAPAKTMAKKSPAAPASGNKTDGKPNAKPTSINKSNQKEALKPNKHLAEASKCPATKATASVISTKKVTEKEASKPKRPPAGAKNDAAAKLKAKAASTKKVAKNEAPPSKKRTTSADGTTVNSLSDFWSDAPRITSKMTKPQLSHELLRRDPPATRLSGKPKSWFLSKLGENSIWTTSEDMKKHHADNLIKAPLVTNSLTKGQLTLEIMTRTPDIKGLSSKSKDDLLSMVAVGSTWITWPRLTTATEANATSNPPPAKRAKTKKKTAPRQSQAKSTPIHASSKAGVSGPSSKRVPLGKIQVNHLMQAKPSASSKRVVGEKAKPRVDGSKQSAKRTGGNPTARKRDDPSRLDKKSLAPVSAASSKVVRFSSCAVALSRASSSTPQGSVTSSSIFESSPEDYDDYSVASSEKEMYFSAMYGY